MPEPWHPHAGQRKAVKALIENACLALLADVGCGKTSSVYGAFKVLRRKGLARRMLVVAPLKPAHLVWPAEAAKWADFADLRVEVLHGKGREAALARDSDVCVVNFDGLEWLLGAVKTKTPSGKVKVTCDVKAFRAHGFDTLVVDELHSVKHHDTVRSKALRAVRETFSRVWGLTATPAPNGLIDLFGQMLVVDGGRTFGPYVTHFRNAYFVPGADGFSWLLRKGADAEIYERMKPVSLRLVSSDYVDVPDLVERSSIFDLPPAAQRVYDALEEDMVAKVADRTVVASNAAAASTKLRQVASGGVYLDGEPLAVVPKRLRAGGREWAHLHDEKTDLVAELVDELQGAPLLVAYDFHHDLERLRARFGKDVPNIGSGVSTRRAKEIEAAWNAGELPLLLGHPQSMGLGLNLQGAGNHVCFYSMPWARDVYDQLIGRVRRQGSRHDRVYVHHLVARGTVDEVVYWALKGKARVQDAFLDAMRAKVRK